MYGASATRVPARGGANIADADIFNIGLLCRCERGIQQIQREIYSMNDFEKKCGSFHPDYLGAYVADSFYSELEKSISVEMKVLMYIDSTAKRAAAAIFDKNDSIIFDIEAGYKGGGDYSAFGNKIAYKIKRHENITTLLTAEPEVVNTTQTRLSLNSVEQLKVGFQIMLYMVTDSGGTATETTEFKIVRQIDDANKSIIVDPITKTFTYTQTVIKRLDWSLIVGVKDDRGVYQVKEEWTNYPFVASDAREMTAAVNDVVTGSEYITLNCNEDNASLAGDQVPVAAAFWIPLTGGDDGQSPDAQGWKSLVEGFADEEMMILLAPEESTVQHNSDMAEYCTQGYKCLYLGTPPLGAQEESLKNLGASLRKPITFGMIPSDKWITVSDPLAQGGKKSIPKVGIDAAHWFNTFVRFGESKVAAGNGSEMVLKSNGTLVENGLIHNDQEGVGQRLIEKYSINICKYRRGKGITNNSARTLSTDNGYKYQNQIMQWLLYKKSILLYLQTIEQDRAGLQAQEAHYNRVWSYMKSKFDAGHLFQGQKENGELTTFSDVCIIINDFSVNTLADLANGIEITFLQFIAPPPIEKPILHLASAPVTVVRA